jgi:hypothetical protein
MIAIVTSFAFMVLSWRFGGISSEPSYLANFLVAVVVVLTGFALLFVEMTKNQRTKEEIGAVAAVLFFIDVGLIALPSLVVGPLTLSTITILGSAGFLVVFSMLRIFTAPSDSRFPSDVAAILRRIPPQLLRL